MKNEAFVKYQHPVVGKECWRENVETLGQIEFSKSQWFELIQSIQHVRIEMLVMGQVSF